MRVWPAGCVCVPVDRRQRMGESGRALLKKEPVIRGGSQSREKQQSKSIRGRAMCRNSHMKKETLAPVPIRVACFEVNSGPNSGQPPGGCPNSLCDSHHGDNPPHRLSLSARLAGMVPLRKTGERLDQLGR